MGRIKEADLIRAWASRPDVFALEPAHIQERYREQVDAERQTLEDAAPQAPAAEEAPKPKRRRKKST